MICMACCKICCGCADCSEGQEGKCCCGGEEGSCCQEGEYCCGGVCQEEPCGCQCEGLECSFERAFDAFGNGYLVGCSTEIANGPCDFAPPGSGPIPYSRLLSSSEPYDPGDPSPYVPANWSWADGYPEALDADCRYLWVCSTVFAEEPCSGGDAECPVRCIYSAGECRLWRVTNCVTGEVEDITSIASDSGLGAFSSSSGPFGLGEGTCECNDPPDLSPPVCEPEAAVCNEFP